MKLLYDTSAIRVAVAQLAQSIEADYAGSKPPIALVGVLTGAVHFASDLSRELVDLPHTLSFVWAESHHENVNGPVAVKWRSASEIESYRNRAVLVVDCIADSGRTLLAVTQQMRAVAASVQSCALVRRISCTAPIKYHAFVATTPSFLVGYGLDFEKNGLQLNRNWRSIYAVNKHGH